VRWHSNFRRLGTAQKAKTYYRYNKTQFFRRNLDEDKIGGNAHFISARDILYG
jgi:hypothetical protein